MSKSSKRRRPTSRGTVDRSATTDVMTQLHVAFRNPSAAAMGAVIGGMVPVLGSTLAHGEVPDAWSSGSYGLALAMIGVVLGCALFSALSVYKFGRAAFGDSRKALGFVLAIEGVMLLSQGQASSAALGLLVVINAIANGSVIALARDATRKRCEADARRAATRARTRARTQQGSEPRTAPQETTRRAPTPAHAPATTPTPAPAAVKPEIVVTQVWRRAQLDDVADAEIVHEVRMARA